MIRITHHRPKCIGCGYCEEIDPFRWKMDDTDGKIRLSESIAKNEIYTCLANNDEFNLLKDASEVCPVNIIKVEKIN